MEVGCVDLAADREFLIENLLLVICQKAFAGRGVEEPSFRAGG